MKKIIYSLFVFVAIANFASCKSEEKKENSVNKNNTENNTEKKAEKTAFSLQDANSKINWTAYKTTDKKPVNGVFQKVEITKNGTGNTVKEAINNAEFSIPVSSIFTKETSRDFKIKKFFFGIMDNTKLLSGKLILENDSTGYANIKMNNISKKLPFTYTISQKTFSLKGILKISDWNAQKALASLNEACKDLHKGNDGVSKTWDDVAINITSTFK